MTLFLMTCVLAAPADAPAPLPAAPAVYAAPAMAVGGCGTGGCGGGACASGICAGTADPCPFEKKGLFAKLRNAFRPKGKCVECLPARTRAGCSPSCARRSRSTTVGPAAAAAGAGSG